jgi:hypothetical protein
MNIIKLRLLIALVSFTTACDKPTQVTVECTFTHEGKAHTFKVQTDGIAPVWHQAVGYVRDCKRLGQ